MNDIRDAFQLAVEKPMRHVVHQVKDINDPTVDIVDEARKLRHLPGVFNVSVDLGIAGTTIVVQCQTLDDKADTIRIGMGGWLVIRRTHEAHPLDENVRFAMDLSGRIMFYSDTEFRERYDIGD